MVNRVQCFPMVGMLYSTMLANSLIISRLVFTLSPKKGRLIKLSSLLKSVNSESACYSFVRYIFVPTHHLTLGTHISGFTIGNSINTTLRTMSGQGDTNLTVSYADLLKAQADKTLIIDVREDSEIQETGKLPGSIHIPMGQVVNELNLSNEEFEKKHCVKKPSCDTKIIVSCRSGRRSASVQADLIKIGYKNILNYEGGWLEWSEHQN